MKTLLLLLVTTALYGQPDFNAVISAIKTGNSTGIGTYMDKNVEVAVEDKDGSYSKAEAISIISSFFDAHAPSHCSLVHSGGAKDGTSYYCIGNLSAEGDKYRVYIFLKKIGASYLIQEMRIEEE
jgi:hypothetical protein